MAARSGDSRVEAATLCRLLGDWPEAGRTLPDALAAAISELIDASVLHDGAILPSQRVLADTLGVSRVTVAEAYDLLSAGDLLAARQGSGSRVRSQPGASLGTSIATEGRLASHTGHQDRAIDLTSGALPGLPMVAATLASLDRSALEDLVAGDGYFPAGLPVLREAIAARYSRGGWPTEPDEVLVTGGAQQAVWLIAHTLVSSGDEVVVEEPTYRGSLEAFRACGARFVAVPMTPTGLDVAHLEQLLARRRPCLLYIQPTAHNPTGVSLHNADRARLADLVQRHGALTIEDTCSADVLLDPAARRAPWGAILPDGPVLTVGTASKLPWGELRVGWIRGSRSAVAHLTEARKAVDMSGPPLEQLLTARLLPHADEALEQRHTQLAAALARATDALREVHPLLAVVTPERWYRPVGGHGDGRSRACRARAAPRCSRRPGAGLVSVRGLRHPPPAAQLAPGRGVP
jgi:DNA-binding transcriptional MocR family regulator